MAFTKHGHQIPGTVVEKTMPTRRYRCGGVKFCDRCKAEAQGMKRGTQEVLPTK